MYLFAYALRSEVLLHSQSQTKSVDRSMADSGAPNDAIFPNVSEVSEMCHSVLGKPV